MAKKTNQSVVVNTVIGAGTEFVGDLRTKDTTRIDGTIRGNIQSEGMVIIGTNGQVEGNINSTWILIDYNDVIVHLFDKEDRLFYDLERIWKDGKIIEL